MNEFCEEKGIKREYSVARTPYQNSVAERRNQTLIEATRTMLTDSKLPTTFWAEAVNAACYVQNRVLVVKPHFKTPYELVRGRSPALSFMRPFGCHVTILNTLDQLEKFDGKSDERIFVGYSTISGVLEWLFDLDALLELMNYVPVPAGTNSNDFADSNGHNKDKHGPSQKSECNNQKRPNAESSTKNVNTAGPSINTANANDNIDSLNINTISSPVNTATPTYDDYPSDPFMPDLEDTRIFDDAYDDRDEGAEADYNNLEIVISVSPIPSTRVHKDHPKEQIIGEVEQRIDGIFLSQDKYVCEISKKFDFSSVKSASTPMETHKPLSKDAVGTDVDVHLYRESYEKRLIEMVEIHTDYNVADLLTKAFDVTRFYFLIASIDKKELAIPGQTTTGKEFSNPLMAELKFVDQHNIVAYLEKSDDNTSFHQIVDFLSSWSINYALTGIDTGGSPRCQETMRGTLAQTRSERVLEQPNEPPLSKSHTSRSGEGRMEYTFELTDTIPPTPHDSPLTGGYAPKSDEGRLKLLEVMNICTTLSNKVTTLENELLRTKAFYHKSFITLTNRVKKLEIQLKQKKSRAVIHSSDEEEPSLDIKDSPKQGRMIEEIDKDENVNLVSEQGEVHETTEPLKDDDDATLAKTLLNIKRSTSKDKGKGIMQETKLPKKIKKREMIQLSLDEELAQKPHAEELAKETTR
nr:retrovirus-related Pol polyprotein from transposon TNT 1-94 [Tanacetum cinerariifolium]